MVHSRFVINYKYVVYNNLRNQRRTDTKYRLILINCKKMLRSQHLLNAIKNALTQLIGLSTLLNTFLLKKKKKLHELYSVFEVR